jgi:hypothetical protein
LRGGEFISLGLQNRANALWLVVMAGFLEGCDVSAVVADDISEMED